MKRELKVFTSVFSMPEFKFIGESHEERIESLKG